MNLVAHAAVGTRHSPGASPAYLVGCMLPDLAAMARVRLGPATGDLADGVRLHHTSDAAFHSSRWFNHHNQALRDVLLAADVDRGASRACAHAGLEMLLDGRLVDDPEVARAGATALHELTFDGPTRDAAAALVPVASRSVWVERLEMIGRNLDPSDYRSPSVVAHRLRRITRGRARIELPASQVAAVARALTAYRPLVMDSADAVLADVVAAVRAEVPATP